MKWLLLLALALTPILNPTSAQARYRSGFNGRMCDKYMGKWAAEKTLIEQQRFALNCLYKIREEAGRDHDAYMLWLGNINRSQGKSDLAGDMFWAATVATKRNNELDGRSENDFMAIAFMSMLLWVTDDFKNYPSIEDVPNETAKGLADMTTAVMKLAGCPSAEGKVFYDNPRGIIYSDDISVNFGIRDTTLSKEEQVSQCAFASVANIFATLSITDNFEYLNACTKARSAAKLLSDKKYKGLKDSLGKVYIRMTDALSKGRCKVI